MSTNKSFIMATADNTLNVYQKVKEMHQYSTQLNIFFKKYLQGNMISMGGGITNNISKCFSKNLNSVSEINNSYIFKDIPMYLDSGGFQIISGQLPLEQVESYIDEYYKLLEDNISIFNHAFMLDIPYIPAFNISFDKVKYLNQKSYRTFNQLSDELKKKMIFISHYGAYENYKVFDELMYELDYTRNFDIISVGSMVNAGHNHDFSNKIIGYIKPVLSFLKHRSSDTNFKQIHYLGVGMASGNSRLIYKLIELIVKKRFGIDLLITHDSAPVKSWRNRQVPLFSVENKRFDYIPWFSRTINHIYKDQLTYEGYILSSINTLLKEDDIGQVEEIPMIGDLTKWGFLFRCCCCKTDFMMNELSRIYAEKMYDLYLRKEFDLFSNYFCDNIIQKSNFHKSKRMNHTISAYLKMIDMLHNNMYDYVFDYQLKKISVKSTELLQV